MITIGVAEFRKNTKKYLDLVEKEKVLIHRGKGKSYYLVPSETVEDEPYDSKFLAKILKGREDIKNGLGIKMTKEHLNEL